MWKSGFLLEARLPKIMRIHFIGIGGIGISALAQYYLAIGHQVSGSDLARSEITQLLKKQGAKIITPPTAGQVGQKAKNIAKDINLVVYSPAVKEDNPELRRARKLGIRCLSYPEALGELTKKNFTIAVCGSHGKSTTTAMLALILIKAGLDPTVIVGTKLKEFGSSNFRMGKSKYLVIEACEYEESFLNYSPKIIVITNIEREHLDYFKNLNNILRAFRKFVRRLPKDGVAVVNDDDGNIEEVLRRSDLRQIGGGQTSPDFIQAKIQNFSIKQRETKKLKKILKVPGEHNIYNALAALATARVLKIPDKISFKALAEYKGCWRRFEIQKVIIDHLLLITISDYAHHPTEIKATLQAAREKFPKKKIWCVFQPHQYQRTFYLFDDFIKVFSGAVKKNWIDKLIITDIYDVAGREDTSIKKKVSSKKLVEKINEIRNTKYEIRNTIMYIPTIKKTTHYLKQNLGGREVVIIMGAGDIDKLLTPLENSRIILDNEH